MKFLLLYFLLSIALSFSVVSVQAKCIYRAPYFITMDSESPSDSSLQVGDHVPDDIRLRLLNYNKKTAFLHEFRSKLLIIDFWNTHCSVCFNSFPKIEKLQKRFSGQMKVLLVTDETDSVVLKYFKIREKLGLYVPPMPVVLGDQQLVKLFQHESEPHEVWIDEAGKVIQISGYEEVTEENIQCVLGKRKCNIPQKNDYLYTYDEKQPLFKNGNGGNGNQMVYHSELSHYVPSLRAEAGYHSNPDKPYGEEVYGLLNINHPVIGLYTMAYDKGYWDQGLGQMGVPVNRTILELKDTLKYCPYINGKKALENWYCYDLVVPNSNPPELKKMMQADLKRYFGLQASLEKRTMKCLVLKMADTSLIHASEKDKLFGIFEDFSIEVRNIPFEKFMFYLTYRYTFPYPLVDETGIKGLINIKFEADMSDYKKVDAAIKKYNMDLVLEDREIEVLVLKD